mmetsp:Transcript_12671/g.21316  ORF Transcript_12671/g.21316 Transcript_12671/m.21316 type:complete len:109 (+) Transcript_12671:104-430(+)
MESMSPSVSQAIDSLKAAYPIKHVMVLMMENRSFDHVFGWFTKGGEFGDDRVDGLYGNECNPIDLNDPSQGQFCANDRAVDVCDDPNHDFFYTTESIFGCKDHFQFGN